MYWPIGAPRLYAATHLPPNHPKSAEPASVRVSDDDASGETVSNGVSPAPLTSAVTADSAASEINNGAEKKVKASSSSAAVEEDISRESILAGDIVGVRLSRSGHLFVTITKSSLTVWQTKVCLLANIQFLLPPLTHHSLAHCDPYVGDPITKLIKELRRKCRRFASSRYRHRGCPNYPWIPDHLRFGY